MEMNLVVQVGVMIVLVGLSLVGLVLALSSDRQSVRMRRSLQRQEMEIEKLGARLAVAEARAELQLGPLAGAGEIAVAPPVGVDVAARSRGVRQAVLTLAALGLPPTSIAEKLGVRKPEVEMVLQTREWAQLTTGDEISLNNRSEHAIFQSSDVKGAVG